MDMNAEQSKINHNVLVVDDDSVFRELIANFIDLSNFKAFSASNAKEAFEILEENNISVVITDIIMPEMDGFELTDLIKKKYNDIDVVLITGYTDEHYYEQAVSKGASDIIFKPVGFAEFSLRLKKLFNERILKKERDKMLQQLEKLAVTDELTKLNNSRHFYKQLDTEVYRQKRYKHPLSILFLDVDHFKKYNDAYGHVKGDKVLVKLGRIIKSCLRAMDTGYRYGGEEFTVILPETKCKEALIVATRIKDLMEAEKFTPVPGEVVTVTISMGITQYIPDERVSNFVQRADKAMYKAKKQGRNRVCSLLC